MNNLVNNTIDNKNVAINLSQQLLKNYEEKNHILNTNADEKQNNIDSIDNDMPVGETNEVQINLATVKDEPTESDTNTNANEIQINEILTDVKTESTILTDFTRENVLDLVTKPKVVAHNAIDDSISILRSKQCCSCKNYFDGEAFSEHLKTCNDNNSKFNSNYQMPEESCSEKCADAGLHSLLDIEIKRESEDSACASDKSLCKSRKRKKSWKKPLLDDPEVIPCDICDSIFNGCLDFALHSIVHSSEKKYHCFKCDYMSESVSDLKSHVLHHEKAKCKCEICNVEFSDETEANEHHYTHADESPFVCDICNKTFASPWLLNTHRESRHREVTVGTPVPKFDPNAIHYKHHVYTSTDIKRHKYYKGDKFTTAQRECNVLCEVCGKGLSSMERLKFHLRVHTGYKPFVCSYCAKPFSRREQLREHERVHTGERPYICRFCGKGFTQRSPLRIHERTHTGERPYQCRLCNKGYVCKGAVDIHMKTCRGR